MFPVSKTCLTCPGRWRLKSRPTTNSVWCSILSKDCGPLLMFQVRTVKSYEQDANKEPLWGEHLTRLTAYWWPSRLKTGAVVLRRSQPLIFVSTDPLTTRFTSYLAQSQVRTSPSWALIVCWALGGADTSHTLRVLSPEAEAKVLATCGDHTAL